MNSQDLQREVDAKTTAKWKRNPVVSGKVPFILAAYFRGYYYELYNLFLIA